MTTLYIQEHGAVIRRTGKRLRVYKGKEMLQEVRLRDLERVALCGSVELSASAMTALLDAGIETVLLSPGGRFRGRLSPGEGKNVFLRRMQFRAYEDAELRLRVARSILRAKFMNSRDVLRRHFYHHPSAELADAIAALEKSPARLQQFETIESLLGVEGDAARVYFAAFGTMVRSEFAFTTRSRRPPRDAVNAVLSFGYTLATTELVGAVAAEGLDPHVGLIHDLDYGRPSLALDLLEEFRQPLVDRLTLSLFNRRVLRPEHFEDRGENGVYLNDSGRPQFLEFYYRSVETRFQDPSGEGETSYRELFRRQASRIRATIETGAAYEPFAARALIRKGEASDGDPPNPLRDGL